MGKHTIYKNEAGKQKLQQCYEDYLQQWDIPVERLYVPTRWGQTHVLVCGPADGKPVLVLQGGNCLNPVTLSWFLPLAKEYRLIAPDTIGHPGFSAETRVSAADNSLALWSVDVLDYFGIPQCACIGPSYGGGIILRLAAFAPERVACAVLAAPAGIVLGSKWRMIQKVLLPLLAYKLTGSSAALRRMADALSFGSMKEQDEEILGYIFRFVKLEQNMPKLTDREELRQYHAPTMLIAGTEDLFFPGEAVVKQAQEIIPNLSEYYIHKMGHFPNQEHLAAIQQQIQFFLQTRYNTNIIKCD